MEEQKSIHTVAIISTNERCKPNAITCSRLESYCKTNEHVLTDDPRKADLILVNTCAAVEFLEKTTVTVLSELVKQRKKGSKVITVGCMNAMNRSVLEESFPEILILDDLADLDKWFEKIQRFSECKSQCLDEVTLQKYTHEEDKANIRKRLILFVGHLLEKVSKRLRYPNKNVKGISRILDELEQRNRVYVQIGSGCINNCSYCAIKIAKGEPVSRPIEDILNDIRKIYRDGKVLSLVADDCGSFGVDTGNSFPTLIYRINDEFPGIPIDCSYLNPVWIEQNPDEYVELFRNVKINTINLSLQSGSNRIIRKMNRKYDIENVLNKSSQIKTVSPDTFLWTHFIVGYPSETWSDFYQSVRASNYFDFYAAYTYCPRKGTVAAELPQNNPQIIRNIRKTLLHLKLAFRLVLQVLGFSGRVRKS